MNIPILGGITKVGIRGQALNPLSAGWDLYICLQGFISLAAAFLPSCCTCQARAAAA